MRERPGSLRRPCLISPSSIAAWAPLSRSPLRIFVPDRCDGVYLHIHGGGFVFGASDLQDENLWRLAQACNVAVVSVEYRLAPENPYPAGPDDCEAAAVWLVANASDRFGTERLFIGGESAGGNLAAVTILRMRDRHQYMGWVGADLVYGAFEFGGGCPARKIIGRTSLVIGKDSMGRVESQYIGDADPTDPYISPLRASLDGLPPALFSCGTSDPLLDDTLFRHAPSIAAGNSAEIAIYPGATHAFDEFDAPLAESCFQRRHAFVRDRLSGSS